MCGIVGFTGRDQAAPILIDGLKKLEYRGYDSAGVAINGDTGITMVKVSGKINKLCEKTENGAAISGSAGIGHTRWATHGAPNDINAHPHMSMDGKFAIVHNGIIENYAELRGELQEKGYEFLSETDTEVIVHLLDHYYGGDLKETIMKTVSRLEGSYALGVICSDFPETVFTARQNSPLILGVGVGENYFASDVTALVSRTKNVIYLDDGDFAELSPSTITVFDCIGRPVQKQISRVAWDVEAAEKGGYEHFMLKEIMEQPRAVKAAIEPRVRLGRIAFDELELTDEYLANVDRIYITACGSAFHAGQVGKYALESLLDIPVEVDFASEFRYRGPIVNGRSLVIVISQSGETADTIAALNEARRRGAKTVAIVNVVGSTIAKTADHVLYTWAGPEIAVATTKGYTTQVAVLYMLAVCLASRLRRISAETEARLTEEILKLPSQIQRAIDLNPHISYLAKRYHENSSVFFIGRNIDYAACLEGSLKLKEISYIHSEAYAAGELKHGTIALIEPGRLVVCLACCERLFDKMMSNVKEVKARGARVIGVTAEGRNRIFSEADDVIFVPTAEELFCAVSEIIPLQLFAYHVAKENGCDIDKPKNLAKSVTVE